LLFSLYQSIDFSRFSLAFSDSWIGYIDLFSKACFYLFPAVKFHFPRFIFFHQRL
jgi:hypothetical protein